MTPGVFVDTIWKHGAHDFGVYAINNGHWQEHPVSILRQEAITADPQKGDIYFAPVTFAAQQRREVNVEAVGVMYADVDGLVSRRVLRDIPPSFVVASGTPGHGHCYWLLDKPYPLPDWKPRNKGLTQALGADPAGWDTTQVLRVPGTINHKNGHIVTAVVERPDRVYSLTDFPEATVNEAAQPVSMPQVLKDRVSSAVIPFRDAGLISEYDAFILSATASDLRLFGPGDRSKYQWGLYHRLAASGFSATEVFQIIAGSAVDKFQHAPGRLWADIQRAIG